MMACDDEDWLAELVAVNVTLYLPVWAAAGVHSKPPLTVLKVASAGRSDAVSWSGRSAGSTAETVKLTGPPSLATWRVGAVTMGWDAAVTWTVS